MSRTFAVSTGGVAGQGVATPGDIFDDICPLRTSRQRAYNTVPVDNSWRTHVPNPLSNG